MEQLHQFHKIFQGLPVISFTIALGLIVLTLGRKLFGCLLEPSDLLPDSTLPGTPSMGNRAGSCF